MLLRVPFPNRPEALRRTRGTSIPGLAAFDLAACKTLASPKKLEHRCACLAQLRGDRFCHIFVVYVLYLRAAATRRTSQDAL